MFLNQIETLQMVNGITLISIKLWNKNLIEKMYVSWVKLTGIKEKNKVPHTFAPNEFELLKVS
jgi:hypothetical protein